MLSDEFRDDLEKVRKILKLAIVVDPQSSGFGSEHDESLMNEDDSPSKDLLRSLLDAPSLSLLPGILLPYVCGRFEDNVKQLVQAIAMRKAKKAGKFSKLPEKLQTSLNDKAIESISNPRTKSENLKNIISIMHQNLVDDSVAEINYTCVTITESNLKPRALSELFKNVDSPDILGQVALQAKIWNFFDSKEKEICRKQIETRLNEIMDKRNMIAHPSNSVTWPSVIEVFSYLAFLEVLFLTLEEIEAA
jgi:hypothetical protein